MKTFKTWLLTIAVLLCSISASAYDFESGGIYYNITSSDDKTVEVTYGEDDFYYSASITIPESVTYDGVAYSVTSIGNDAFNDCSGLTSINIPTNVTSIGNNAFNGCSGLTSIDIPTNVTSIGKRAFYGCSGLTSIDIPHSVTQIEPEAFSACPDLTFITVSVDNPNYDSRDNSNAIIETSSNTLLSGCKNTVIPVSVTNIGDNAFSNCYGLTSIDIPNGVTSIGDFAFYGCTGLTSIVIPSSVTSIGNYAFWDCIFLRVVLNYSSLDIWKGSKENGCVASYAYIVLNNVDGIVDDFVFTENDGQYYLSACLRGDSVLSLPEHYKNKGYGIGDSVFCNRNELIAITIPKGVTSIKSKSFSGCLALTSIDIPHTVTQIEPGAFRYCN